MYFAPPVKGFTLELGINACSQKKIERWATGPRKKFDDSFSHVDTIHQRYRKTDGRIPGDRKDRAYA